MALELEQVAWVLYLEVPGASMISNLGAAKQGNFVAKITGEKFLGSFIRQEKIVQALREYSVCSPLGKPSIISITGMLDF